MSLAVFVAVVGLEIARYDCGSDILAKLGRRQRLSK